jgi:hypothetical protein
LRVRHLRLNKCPSASFQIDILDKGKGETIYDRRNGCVLLRERMLNKLNMKCCLSTYLNKTCLTPVVIRDLLLDNIRRLRTQQVSCPTLPNPSHDSKPVSNSGQYLSGQRLSL